MPNLGQGLGVQKSHHKFCCLVFCVSSRLRSSISIQYLHITKVRVIQPNGKANRSTSVDLIQ